MDHTHLTRLFETGESDDPLKEILTLLSIVAPTLDHSQVKGLHAEIASLFSGGVPGYRASNTKYHNLGHTYSVVLATVRLFHGLSCEGRAVSDETVKKAVYSAYFHDCGLLLRKSEKATTGAAYTKEHEARSILFMKESLKERGYPEAFINDCSLIIQCTDLGVDPDVLDFPSEEVQLAGFVVGSADILAQMADRYYLERLPLLFQEHQEGGITMYNSAVELMQHTTFFYHHVIVDRLERVFSNIVAAMQTHFRERWDMDRNLYLENISHNINYIKIIVQSCEEELECLQSFLRRTPPN